MATASLREYVFDYNYAKLVNYITDNFRYIDYDEIYRKAWKYPGLFKFIIDSEVMDNEEKWNLILKYFFRKKPPLFIIYGDVGSGKTGLGAQIAELLNKRNKKVAFAMIPDIPSKFQIVDSPEEADSGSIIILDEAGIMMSARRPMAEVNVKMSSFLQIRRHQDKGLIFLTQHPKLADVNLLRLATGLFFKPMPAFEVLEKITKSEYESMTTIDTMLKLMPLKKTEDGWSDEFVFTDFELGFKAVNPIPAWFTEKQSKQFVKIDEYEAYLVAKKMIAKNISPKVISKRLNVQGIEWTALDVEYFAGMPEVKFKKLKW